MTIMHRVGAMLMLFLFPGISWAQEQKVQSVTLDLKTAIGIALNENPTIKVADGEIEKKGNYRRIIPSYRRFCII